LFGSARNSRQCSTRATDSISIRAAAAATSLWLQLLLLLLLALLLTLRSVLARHLYSRH